MGNDRFNPAGTEEWALAVFGNLGVAWNGTEVRLALLLLDCPYSESWDEIQKNKRRVVEARKELRKQAKIREEARRKAQVQATRPSTETTAAQMYRRNLRQTRKGAMAEIRLAKAQRMATLKKEPA